MLIAGDVGAALAMDVVERARAQPGRRPPRPRFAPSSRRCSPPREPRLGAQARRPGSPAIVLVVGVNGTGKTTTIGKLAARYAREGRRVLLAAADTFRAAAIEQLRIWAERAEVPSRRPRARRGPGGRRVRRARCRDRARRRHVIADTAGRLHTKSNLMDELSKIRRIDRQAAARRGAGDAVRPRRDDRPERPRPGARVPRGGRADGHRAHQARFDGQGRDRVRDRGRPRCPVRFVGVGEKVDDLIPFDPDAFVAALFA